MADSPQLIIVGDGPVTEALTAMVAVMGWPVSVTSDAPTIGGDIDILVVTSHDEGADGPAIRSALAAGTFYVGAMGSRRTQTRRREWLLAAGVTEDALVVLRAPIGLDIGADQPGEIAVSILAEIIAQRSGRLPRDRGQASTATTSVASAVTAIGVNSIGARDGAIHPELAAGEAFCPGG